MTSRIQEQRFATTATKPANGARPSGELWLNLPDLRLGLIDPAHTAVDLLGVRQYAATSSYALGDYVVHAGDLLRSKAAITPHAFLATDWDTFPTKAANDALYTTQAQNDIRYYTKAQSDANYYSKTYIDANFYTRTQSDARYYTQAQTDARYLQLTGGALTGELTVGGGGVHYTQAGGSNHAMALGWDGSNILAWVDGSLIGALATQAYVNSTEALYLRLTGGTLTGALQVNANTTILGTLQNSNGRLITYAPNYAPSLTLWKGDTGAMGFWYDGNLNFGGIGGDGSPSAYYGRLRADGSIEVTNRTIAAQGMFANSSQDFGVFQSGQYRIVQYASAWGLWWDTTNGNLFYQTPSGLRFLIDGSGNTTAWGNIHANNHLEAGDDMWLGNGGAGSILQFHSGWYWEWNAGNGDLIWGGPSGAQFWVIRYSDHYCGNQIGPVFGIGGYIDFSDVRAKTDIETANQGLAEIQKLTPITFRHAGKDRSELGFGAQDVQQILPEAVHPVGIPLSDGSGAHDSEDPSLGVSLTPIVAALVNAIKDLATRIDALETK